MLLYQPYEVIIMLPITGGVRIVRTNDPRDLLMFGIVNSYWWSIGTFFGVLFQSHDLTAAILCAIGVYTFRAFLSHRRIFVLKEAPDKHGFLMGGWIGSKEDFQKFMDECGVTVDQLERDFWKDFFVFPGLFLVLSLGAVVMK